MFGTADKKSSRRRRGKPAMRLHSVAALMKQRAFVGGFDAAAAAHSFIFTPAKAEARGGKLRLEGQLEVTDRQGVSRSNARAVAVLAATQGGIGAAPVRRQPLAAGESASAAAASQQQEQKARMIETQNTGPLSFCGVMYFHFEPLDARALGVAADLSRVQMNARLAPIDDAARELHGLYCSIVDALYGEPADEKAAEDHIAALNKLLSAN